MKALSTILKDYLNIRRSLGFDLQKDECALRGFVKFFDARSEDHLTTSVALQWARQPEGTDPAWWTDRLGMLRHFATYWRTEDPRTEVPPLSLLVPYYKRPTPYIYSEQEIVRILAATRQAPSKDRLTYWTLFGLLAITGLRIGEALALDDADVDLDAGTLNIRDGKRGRARMLPLHPTTCQKLRTYRQWRRRRFGQATTSAFFRVLDGRRPSYRMPWNIFKQVLVTVGLRTPSQKKGPRLHDLRHTFAVRTLIRLYQEDQVTGPGIQALSMYLGHADIRSTYWYLTAIPELMALALARLEASKGDLL